MSTFAEWDEDVIKLVPTTLTIVIIPPGNEIIDDLSNTQTQQYNKTFACGGRWM
jgi:hypothetical protein